MGIDLNPSRGGDVGAGVAGAERGEDREAGGWGIQGERRAEEEGVEGGEGAWRQVNGEGRGWRWRGCIGEVEGSRNYVGRVVGGTAPGT